MVRISRRLLGAEEAFMDEIQIVIMPGPPYPAEVVDELRALDPRLRVHGIAPEERAAWRKLGDEGDPDARTLAEALRRAEIIIHGFNSVPNLPELAPNLRWMHTPFAGVERIFELGLVGRSFTVTNGSGPAATPIAQWVIMALLMLAKQQPAHFRAQLAHEWARIGGFELGGKTLGIIGLGAIGREVARLARPFGMRIVGVRRSVGEPLENQDGADLVLPPSAIPRLLAESDFVLLAAPSTNETAALIDAAALATMRPGGYLLNVARGSLLDEEALVAALQSGQLAGAALDVFATEPLPADSPLWDLPNVIITPHDSPASQFFFERVFALFLDNLRAYLAGDLAGLTNVVTLERGY
jgi:phosphoglycerate dehydrogenase-like enzyme